METQRLRRRRSRRRARKTQVIWLIILAVGVALFIWTRILIERRNDAALFAANQQAKTEAAASSGTIRKPALAPTATKNLILFVGNGYGTTAITATRIHAAGEQGSLAIDGFPETAMVKTYSKNAQSADSAAAMTALMTGVKVDNEVLSQTPDTRPYDEAGRPSATRDETTCPTAGNGGPVRTLLELAKGSGRAVGIVTTARVTEAVTAASYAHLCHRGGENAIAGQLAPGGPDFNAKLGEGVDVVFGGGWQNFLPKDDPRGSARNDTRDLFAEMRAKGYTLMSRHSELAATTQPVGKVLGLFSKSRMSHEVDRLGGTEPSLADMTVRAIDLLQRNTSGYMLVVEAGRIGEAIEGSVFRKAIGDAQAFDQAISVTLTKVRELDPDLRNTTIVVTADHDQTLVINGDSTLVGRTAEGRPGIVGVLRGVADPTQFVPDAGGRPYTSLVSITGDRRVKGSRAQSQALSDLLLSDRNVHYESAVEARGIGGSDVPLSAIGANAQRFHGTIDNTQVFGTLKSAMGL